MSRDVVVGVVLGVLACVAFAYFLFVAVRSRELARVLLRRGFDERGWTEERLALRLRILGAACSVLAAVGVAMAAIRVLR